MEVTALASGSSGNCFYIGNSKEAVLIDAGISAKQIIQRMRMLGLDSKKVKALFITHEHIDHIRGADVLARQLGIPVYATKKTLQNGFICSDEKLLKAIRSGDELKIGKLFIESFSKSHGAAEPVSYTVVDKKRVAVITDAGYACKNIKKHISDSDFLFLESNHDEKMLEKGPYPYFLKKLISSDLGHLSNLQAGLCVLECASPNLLHVILSHLSRTNNTPELALKTFNSLLKERKDFRAEVHVSLGEEPTKLFNL